MRPAGARAWPFVLVTAAPAILFAPFLAGAQMFYWGTPLLQFYPWRLAALTAVRAGAVPLWNPWLGNGAPLLANYQSALLYPPNWLALILPLDLALNWLLVLHVMWTGAGMVVLARALGYRPFGQAVAGLAFGLSQYTVARAGFYSINAALAWLPWVIWAGELLTRSLTPLVRRPAASPPRWRPALAAALRLSASIGFQLLAGHAQTTWYTLVLLGAWLVWRLAALSGGDRGWLLWRGLVLSAGAVAAAGLVAAAQLLPTAELLRESPRAAAAGYDFVMTYSFSPWRLLTLVAPDLLGNPARGHFYGYGNYLEDAVYLGVLPLMLGLAAAGRVVLILLGGRRRATWAAHHVPAFLTALLPVAVLLALGRNTPVFPFLYFNVPTFNLFQAPTRLMAWFVFALALLGGWGADHWLQPAGRALYWTRLGAAGAASIIATAGAALALLPGGTELGAQLRTVAAAVLAAGVNLLAGALLSLTKPAGDSRPWTLAAAGLLAADLIFASWGLNPGAPADLYRAPTASGAALAPALAETGQRLYQFPTDEYEVKFDPYFSFLTYGPPELAWAAREAQLPNVAGLDGLASASNFEPLVSARYLAWTEVVSATRSPALLAAADVGVVASRAPLAWPVAARGPDVAFYRVPGAARRAWVVYAARPAAGAAAARTLLADPGFDPEREVILEPAAAPPAAAPPAANAADPNQFQMEVALAQDGWLVVADTYYPGWRAWVDGRPAAVQPANLAFRAVAVPAGAHTVRFAFQPASWTWGVRLSLAGLVVWAGLGLWLWGGREPSAGGRGNNGGTDLTGR